MQQTNPPPHTPPARNSPRWWPIDYHWHHVPATHRGGAEDHPAPPTRPDYELPEADVAAVLIGLGFWMVCMFCAYASVGLPQLVSRQQRHRIVGPQWNSRHRPRSSPARRKYGSRENAAELVQRLAPEYDPHVQAATAACVCPTVRPPRPDEPRCARAMHLRRPARRLHRLSEGNNQLSALAATTPLLRASRPPSVEMDRSTYSDRPAKR